MFRQLLPTPQNLGAWALRSLALACVWAPLPVLAAVPGTALLEGVLTATGGGAAADGNYDVVISVYADASGGNPVYTEGPVTIGVKNGTFWYELGTVKKLDAGAIGALPKAWLGIKIGAEPELPRKALHSSVFSLRAAIADGLDCSGCVTTKHISPTALADYVKTKDISKVALTGLYTDLNGSPPEPDLSAYAKKAAFHPVAFSGAYKDLTGGPDLSPYAVDAKLSAVAHTNAFKDLSGIPAMAKLGDACGTGLVIKGLKGDGTYECVPNMDPNDLPPDGIDEISNKLIFNQFTDSFSGKTNVLILDNNPDGSSDTIDYPDIGIAQKLVISIDVSNSNISKIVVTVEDPDKVVYVLYGGASSGGTLVTSYPDPTKPVSGDLTTWVGKNPKGKWTLKVVDSAFKTNTTDGAINKWTISVQTLSNKKIAVAGKLIVAGDLEVQGNINAASQPKYGGVFTRWGSKKCPTGSDKLYDGAGLSGHYSHANPTTGLCVKGGDPGPTTSYEGNLLYPMHTSGESPPGIADGKSILCSVCQWQTGSCFEQWGSHTCPTAFSVAYRGYGMGGHYTHTGPTGHYCIETDEFDGSVASTGNGHLYNTRLQSKGNYGGAWTVGTYVKCAQCCR
ncbi:MAG: hypothetical protein EXR79_09695 [Myxococcales bacterium]|nr:hypothetical protein [Myxococcales bacterium]